MKECTSCHIVQPVEQFNKIKAYRRARCKTCTRAEVREWKRQNAEHHKAYHREYIAKWKQINSDKVAAYANNRRALQLGAEGSHSETEWLELCEKFSNRCLRCGKLEKLTRDHIVPLSLGGGNSIENIQPLCWSCNSIKSTKVIDYR